GRPRQKAIPDKSPSFPSPLLLSASIVPESTTIPLLLAGALCRLTAYSRRSCFPVSNAVDGSDNFNESILRPYTQKVRVLWALLSWRNSCDLTLPYTEGSGTKNPTYAPQALRRDLIALYLGSYKLFSPFALKPWQRT